MLRQCAWCLRLIDSAGERLSVHPLPKLYEASHGMCSVCGALWMEQVLNPLASQTPSLYLEKYNEQRSEPIPLDAPPSSYALDPSIHYQQISAVPVVCESSNEYSAHVGYSLSEGSEIGVADCPSDPDLFGIIQRNQS